MSNSFQAPTLHRKAGQDFIVSQPFAPNNLPRGIYAMNLKDIFWQIHIAGANLYLRMLLWSVSLSPMTAGCSVDAEENGIRPIKVADSGAAVLGARRQNI